MSCLEASEGEYFDNPLICQLMNLWALSDKGTRVRFCWVQSHCGIKGNEIVDQLAKEALGNDIDPLTTVHFADLKPLVNSYIQQEVQIRDLYPETNTRTTQEISAPDQIWGSCDDPTPNWPYQGHKMSYLVQRTTDCLQALWQDSDHWKHTPGMYSAAT